MKIEKQKPQGSLPTAMANLLLLGLLSTIYACSHPVEIVGKGDVISASGTRGCTLEQFAVGDEACTKNSVIGDYQETYYAQPRDGYVFDHWENCAQQFPRCNIGITAAMVQPFWGQTTPPLRAVFVPVPVLRVLSGYSDSLLFTGKLESCVTKNIPELHCAALIDPDNTVKVRFDLQLDNNFMSVGTDIKDSAGNFVGGTSFVVSGDIIYKRIWETGFEAVGVEPAFDREGISFFHVRLDKGRWTAAIGASATPGTALFDLWTNVDGYTTWNREITGGVWDEDGL